MNVLHLFFFSPHCQCFPQLHSVSVKLLSAGTQQRRGLVLNTSSLWSIHMAYHFPNCLITATALCPDLNCLWSSLFNLPSAATSNLTSCPSHMSFSSPTVLLTPPGLRWRVWKFALYTNRCQHCSTKVSWIMSKKSQIWLQPGVRCISLAGRYRHHSLYDWKDKRVSRVKCCSALLELWAGRPKHCSATQRQGCPDVSDTAWRWTRPPLPDPSGGYGQHGAVGGCRRAQSRADLS